MPLRNLVVIFVSAAISMACYAKAERNRYASVLTEAMALIRAHYVEEVDPRQLFEGAMNGMVEGLDPYSSYFSPESFRQIEESLDQEFGGIGIVVEVNPATNRLTVMSPLVGTPAYEAGIRAGDVILEIDGNSTEGMDLKDAVTLMRGAPGTPVDLLLRRSGQEDPERMQVSREIIPVESVMGDTRRPDGSWEFQLEQNPRIGYVRLTTFGKHTVDELTEVLQSHARGPDKFDGLILDLRNNAGGLLDAAVDICDMFISEGRIVSTRGREGEVRGTYSATPQTMLDPSVPIVVLINRYSASASEIVAACLQDHERAVVVGERSWGKGTVQNIIELEGGQSALKLTTASYWRPSGRNIHRRKEAGEEDDWGVRPNPKLEVKLDDAEFEKVLKYRRERDVFRPEESANGASESGVSENPGNSDDGENAEPFVDPQLQRAVEWLEKRMR